MEAAGENPLQAPEPSEGKPAVPGVRAPAKKFSQAARDPTAHGGFAKVWLLPAGVILGAAVGLFIVARFADVLGGQGHFLSGLVLGKPDAIEQAVQNVSQVIVGVLGLVITVVAIVVQLAAQRYTPKLVDLFVTDRVNISYFLLMVVTAIYCLILSYTAADVVNPFWGGVVVLALTVVILALLGPYFSYVFQVLTPGHIIYIIRKNANGAIEKVSARSKPQEMRRLQTDVANSMEQISDISLSAVSQMDRNVALLSIRSLKDLMVDHLLLKRRLPARWFVPQKEHFSAISTDFLHEIAVTRVWVEVKGFMDMELIFKMAIKDMPDGVSAVANSTKIVGLYAIRLRDFQVLNNVIQFFNTFLRHAVNDRNPKAIYNLFYQYRMLAEEVLSLDPKLAERIMFYFKYYGQTAQSYQIPMILITASFDMMHMLRKAYLKQVPNLHALMTTFLEIDDNPATQSNEFDLRSVRKAQLMFASFLLSQGDDVLVRRIFEDLKTEPATRMTAIRNEMMAVRDRKFWEVTDRGVDFFYIDDEQKKFLGEFYARFIEPHYAQQEKRPA
jgi:hypothetical protein